MAQAVGSAAAIRIQLEKFWGVLPTTPNMTEINSAAYGESIGSTADELISNAINPNRGLLDVRNGQVRVQGGVPFELPVSNAEILFYALMGGYVQTNETVGGVAKKKKVFKRAATLPSFMIEKAFTDNNDYFKILGCRADNLELTVDPEGIVSGSINIMGQSVSASKTPFDATPNVVTHKMYAGIDGVVLEGGSGAKFQNFTFTVSNGIYDSRIIGSKYSANLGAGDSRVSGELTIMFENLDLYNKWEDEEQSDIKITFSLGNDSTEFHFKRVKFGGDGLAKIATKEGIQLTFSFNALVDAVEKTDVTITVINDIDFNAIVNPTP